MRRKTSAYRRMAIQGFDAVSGGHYFHALLEFEVGAARAELRRRKRQGARLGWTAFMLKAIAASLAEFPALNACVTYRRSTEFDGVDIAVPVEVFRPGGKANRQVVIRGVDTKSVAELQAELDAAKQDTAGSVGFVGGGLVERLLAALPRFLASGLIRLAMADHTAVRAYSGTVFVTTVGMFSNASGHLLPYAGGPKAVSFALGGITAKPVVRAGRVEAGDVQSLTVSFNHDAVDGADAARFVNTLRRKVERDFGGLMADAPDYPGG